MRAVLVLLALVAVAAAKFRDIETTQYVAEAIVVLPYAGISEPVRIYYDLPNNRSRTEYYDGQDVYIYRPDIGDYGTLFQVVPETLSVSERNIMTCFQVNGTNDSSVSLQTMLPDLSLFKFVNTTYKRGLLVEDWIYISTGGDRTNEYHFYYDPVRDMPVQYHMFGYDSLWGSHYDEYVLNYMTWTPGAIADTSVFNPPNMPCGGFPGPGMEQQQMRGGLGMIEDYEQHDMHVKKQFKAFSKTHNKVYADDKEHAQRETNFRHHLHFIESKNRQHLSFKVAVNHMADYHKSELAAMRGSKSSPRAIKAKSTGKVGPFEPIDWRLSGAVTPVKDQGICGSCWSFATAATIEGANYLKSHSSVPLSQQVLMDCSWGYGNNACDGGEAERALQFVIDNKGIPTESSYGVYKMADGFCHVQDARLGAVVTSYVNVTSEDQTAMYNALATQGPLAIAIDAGHLSFVFYSSGVYYEPDCGSDEDSLDHAVLAIGYGIDAVNGDYWIVKNSWSEYWGDEGYVKMSLKDNNCGCATDANYAIVA